MRVILQDTNFLEALFLPQARAEHDASAIKLMAVKFFSQDIYPMDGSGHIVTLLLPRISDWSVLARTLI